MFTTTVNFSCLKISPFHQAFIQMDFGSCHKAAFAFFIKPLDLRGVFLQYAACFMYYFLFCFIQNYNSCYAQKNLTVAVIEFKNSTDLSTSEISTLTQRFRSVLASRHIVTVLERERMGEILKEQDFILSDNCNTNECAIQVGQLLGVQVMISGEFGKVGDVYTIDTRCIDVESGRNFSPLNMNYEGKPNRLLVVVEDLAKAIEFTERRYSVRHLSSDHMLRWKLAAGTTVSVARSSFLKIGYSVTQSADLTFSDRLSMAMGLSYVVKQTSYISTYDATYHYVEIPLVMQYALFEQLVTRSAWTAYAGYAPSFKIKAARGDGSKITSAKPRDNIVIAGVALRPRRGYGFYMGFAAGLVSVKQSSKIHHRTIYTGATYTFR